MSCFRVYVKIVLSSLLYSEKCRISKVSNTKECETLLVVINLRNYFVNVCYFNYRTYYMYALITNFIPNEKVEKNVPNICDEYKNQLLSSPLFKRRPSSNFQ